MKWNGSFLVEIVKERLYSLLWKQDVKQALLMSDKEYAAFLKSVHSNAYCNASNGGGGMPTISGKASGITIEFTDRTFNDGDNLIEIPWSMAARHIRAWEYKKAHSDTNATSPVSGLSKVQDQWDRTHLCGDRYNNNLCEYFLQTDSKDTIVNGKKLDRSCYYCTSENKIRKIGFGGSWTGLSPKFCPKRKALEEQKSMCDSCANNDGNCLKPTEGECLRFVSAAEAKSYLTNNKEDTMARKMQFDTSITKDMMSAASDSFMDNIKMIDISEIAANPNNFYELSDIELLADDIEREGLKHNLVVTKNLDTGKFDIKSGHRRLAAIKRLVDEKRMNSSKIPCYIDGEKTAAELQFDLIMLNATQRKYSDADVLHEYEEIERTFKALEAEGKPLKGRIRDNIANILRVSPAQVGKIENIKHNAIPEVEEAVKGGVMSISTAHEVAKLSEEKQQEIVKEKPKISYTEVKELQKQEKPSAPPKPAETKPVEAKKANYDEDEETDDLDNDLDDFDNDDLTEDDIEDREDDLDEDEPIDTSHNDDVPDKTEKKSSLTFSVKFSDDELGFLLKFIEDNLEYTDNEETIIAIWDKLHSVYGE